MAIKYRIREFMEVTLPCWLMVNALVAFGGLFESASLAKPNACDNPLSRIEYVFPGFQVGCWLGRAP